MRTEVSERNPSFRLTENEQQQYSLARAISVALGNIERSAGGTAGKRENSFETEISEQIEKEWTRQSHGGVFIPWSIRHNFTTKGGAQKRAGLDSNSGAAGGDLVFTEPGTFIQFLYNRMRVKELGARPSRDSATTSLTRNKPGRRRGRGWSVTPPGTDVADAALTLGSVASSPKTYQSSSSYSRQLLAQAVVDVDTLVREDLARDMALALDFSRHRRRRLRPAGRNRCDVGRTVLHRRSRQRKRRRARVGRHRSNVGSARNRERRSARRRRMAHDSGRKVIAQAHRALGEHHRPADLGRRRHRRRVSKPVRRTRLLRTARRAAARISGRSYVEFSRRW